jgi:hypothetical protein
MLIYSFENLCQHFNTRKGIQMQSKDSRGFKRLQEAKRYTTTTTTPSHFESSKTLKGIQMYLKVHVLTNRLS